MKKSAIRLVAIIALGALFGAPAQSASAAETEDFLPQAIICDGTATWIEVSSASKAKSVTHASKYYNGTSSNSTATYSAGFQKTLSAGITYTQGASVSGDAVIAKLEASVSLSLAASGSVTSSSSTGIQATIKPGKYVVVAAGNSAASGNWVQYKCNNGAATTLARGGVKSFAVKEIAAVQCDLTQPAGSLAAVAKSAYC